MAETMTGAVHPRGMFPEATVLRTVFSSPAYLLAYLLSAPLVAGAYLILLPGLILGSYQLWVLRFVTVPEAAFAVAMGVLFPAVVLVNLHLWRHPGCAPTNRHARTGTLGALVMSVIPNALCCTPIIPVVLAAFVSGAALVSISAPVQYFLGTYAPVLYLVSALALWASLRVAARTTQRTQVPGSAGSMDECGCSPLDEAVKDG